MAMCGQIENQLLLSPFVYTFFHLVLYNGPVMVQ